MNFTYTLLHFFSLSLITFVVVFNGCVCVFFIKLKLIIYDYDLCHCNVGGMASSRYVLGVSKTYN